MFSREQNKKSSDKAPDKPNDKQGKESTEPRKKSNALQTFLGSVSQLSDILQEFTDFIPAPGLNPALKTLSTIIMAIQDARDNKEMLEDDMLPRIERIRDQIVTPLIDKGDAAEGVAKIVGSRLESALNKIGKKGKEMSEQGIVTRFICHKINKDGIQKFGKQLDDIISEFTLERINQLVAFAREQVEIAQDTRKIILDKAQRDLINGLPHVDAFYKSKNRAGKAACDPNTRMTVLDGIKKWAESPGEPPVYWLCGLAGTGKSTICHTIAKWLDEESCTKLGASYFFSRDKTELADAYSFFPTLAYQLSQFSLDFGQGLAKALGKDPYAPGSVLESQCKALLSQPLSSLESKGLAPFIIVVDALDECSLGVDTSAELLAPLIDAIRSSKTPIRLLISSRPEPEIVECFESLGPDGAYKSLNLHDMDVQNDIRVYLQSRFDELRRLKPKLSRNWITGEEIDRLVAYAVPLFAVAAIMINFVNKPRKDPRKQVKILLDHSSSAKYLPYSHLDSLYLEVLASAYPEDGDDDDRNCLKLLLSTIVTLEVPMSLATLAAFLSIEDEETVLLCLHSVSSVLIIPESVHGAIRIFHASFRDFITDPSRCTDSLYHVRGDETQSRLALRCLCILNMELRPDICDLGAAPYANTDFPDLNDRLAENLPQHLRYSCLYVSAHIISSNDQDGRIARGVEALCSEKLLMWIEVLGLSQQVDILLSSLQTMGEWYGKHTHPIRSVANILSDSFRLVSRFREMIETWTGDIYGPLLALMPSCEMKAAYTTLPSARLICGLPMVDDDWSSYRWAVKLPCADGCDRLQRLSFSPDGRFLAATLMSGKYKVLNARSGAVTNEQGSPLPFTTTLESHRYWSDTMAFSPDGTSLAYADDGGDRKVWIYNLAASSDPRAMMVNPGREKDKIILIAYVKGDDHSLLVVTYFGHINVWSTEVGAWDQYRPIYTPTSIDDHIELAAVSEDGCKLAIVRNGAILDVWDISSGRRLSEGILQLEYDPSYNPRGFPDPKRQQIMFQMLFFAGGLHLAVYYKTEVLTEVGYTQLTTMEILEVETGHCLKSVHKEERHCYLGYMASAGGRLSLLYVCGAPGIGQIHMFAEDYSSYTVFAAPEDLHRVGNPSNRSSTIAFSANGRVLAVGSDTVVSVHDVNSLKAKHTESSLSDFRYYISHGLDGTLYGVSVTRAAHPHVTIYVTGREADRDINYSFRLQEYMKEDIYGLHGYFWIQQDYRSLLVTDLRTGRPCFGFSVKGATSQLTYAESRVSSDGKWMAIRLRSTDSWNRDGEGEIWVHDLDSGAFIATSWTPGPYCDTDIHLAVDAQTFLAAGYSRDYTSVTAYAMWKMGPSYQLQAPKKYPEWIGAAVHEVVCLRGSGINKQPWRI